MEHVAASAGFTSHGKHFLLACLGLVKRDFMASKLLLAQPLVTMLVTKLVLLQCSHKCYTIPCGSLGRIKPDQCWPTPSLQYIAQRLFSAWIITFAGLRLHGCYHSRRMAPSPARAGSGGVLWMQWNDASQCESTTQSVVPDQQHR